MVSVRDGICMILQKCCFQVFQLTALVVRCPSEVHLVFTVSLNGVAIEHEKMNGAVSYVQDFVRYPLFTQKNCFFETGISNIAVNTVLVKTAVAVADVVRHNSEFDPWGSAGVEAGPLTADLKSCREKIVLRIKAIKDTQGQWFGVENVASSAVGEATPRTSVRISDVVEVGDFQYIEDYF